MEDERLNIKSMNGDTFLERVEDFQFMNEVLREELTSQNTSKEKSE